PRDRVRVSWSTFSIGDLAHPRRSRPRARQDVRRRVPWARSSWTRRFLELHGHLTNGVVLAQGVALPLLGHQDPRQVRVISELHTEEIEGLALHGLGAGIEAEQRVDLGVHVAGLHAYARAQTL